MEPNETKRKELFLSVNILVAVYLQWYLSSMNQNEGKMNCPAVPAHME